MSMSVLVKTDTNMCQWVGVSMYVLLTSIQCILSAAVIFCRLLNVPGCQRQRLHVLETVQFQHVHVTTTAVISGNEAALTTSKYIVDYFLSANFIIHAEKHCNPPTLHILWVSEKLKMQRKWNFQRHYHSPGPWVNKLIKKKTNQTNKTTKWRINELGCVKKYGMIVMCIKNCRHICL